MQVFSSNVKLLCLKMHGGIMQVSKQQFASEIPDMREFLFCDAHVWTSYTFINSYTEL